MKFISLLLIALVCLVEASFPIQPATAGPPVIDDDLTIFDEASQDQQEIAVMANGLGDSIATDRHASDSTTVSTRTEESYSVGLTSPRPPGFRTGWPATLDLWITGDEYLNIRL